MKKILVITASIMLLAAACNKQAAVGPGNQSDNGTSFSGILIAGGAECQLFQTDDGKQYTLTGNLTGFKTGDAVSIKGALQEMSTCQQGLGTIAVSTIAQASAPIPTPSPCPDGQMPVGTTQSIPGHLICGPVTNKPDSPIQFQLPNGKVGVSYSDAIAPVGPGGGNLSNWSVSAGSLPSGLSFGNLPCATGNVPAGIMCTFNPGIFGTPAAAGTYTFSISIISDTNGTNTNRSLNSTRQFKLIISK